MARELFKPFLARQLVRNGSAHDAAEADAMIDRGQADGLLPEAVRGRVVLLNRAPTMDRYYLQAFEPVLTDHNAILLHPLMCRGFNADFDGDQMAVHLPVSDAAQAEARRLMTPLSHLVQSRPSETVIAFDQEIVYGLHYLTAEKTGAKESEKEFTDAAAALSAFEAGRVGLHERIRAARGRETLLTTPGRIVFNAAFPAGLDFVNGMMDRKKLRQLMHDLYTTHGPQVVAGTLDVLQRLGFQYATESGLSIGKDFLRPYTGKPEAMARLREREAAIDRARQEGRLSEDAARHEWTQLWINTTHEIGGSLMREMASDAGGFNPVHRMHVSGSRGSAPQLRQLNGIRGLMINGPRPDGRLTPVEASFIEGLSTWDCFVSGYGSRRGLLDVALKIADAGQLQKKFTLRLADVRITCEDCGTARSQALSPFKDGDCVIEDVAERAVGRIAAEDVSDPESGMRIVAAGGLIDRAAAERIRASGAAGVRIRDIAGCEAADGVCARCYGADVATGQLPAIGSPVGLIAAHAMGEPTSQLTLQAFWGWRKRSDGSWNDGYRVEGGIPRLAALERSGAEVEPEERVRAMTAIFREQWVSVPDKHFELLARAMRGHWRSGWLARAARPRPDETTTGILIRAALACEIDSLAGTVQRVLAGRL
jgi:DNA-directed RNA polymerase subunit beta'